MWQSCIVSSLYTFLLVKHALFIILVPDLATKIEKQLKKRQQFIVHLTCQHKKHSSIYSTFFSLMYKNVELKSKNLPRAKLITSQRSPVYSVQLAMSALFFFFFSEKKEEPFQQVSFLSLCWVICRGSATLKDC